MPRARHLLILLLIGASTYASLADNPAYGEAPESQAATAAESVRRLEYEITRQGRSVIPGHPGGLHAANRAQDLRAYFHAEAVDLVRRSETTPSWKLRLSMRDITSGGTRRPVAWAVPAAEGRIVTYDRGSIIERFENTEHGIDLGLTLPALDEGESQIVFELETDLHLEDSFDRREVSFYQEGRRQVRLRLVGASDAAGRIVEAGLSAGGGALVLRYKPVSGEASGVAVRLSLTGPGVALTGQGLSLTPDWIEEIDQAGAQFGWSASTAGDVNGDGYSDLILGARFYDNGQNNEGAVFVYMGSPSGLSGTAAWMTEGNQVNGTYGFSASTAGDVNGDGYDDVIIGAQDYDNGQNDEGKAWVYQGSASGLSLTASWTAESDQASAQFGTSAGTAGDVNGDGYADVIVGAQRYSNTQINEGRASVYLGGPSGLAPTAAWFAESRQHDAEMGQAVSTAGDVNGDGYSDVLVGALQYDNGQSNEGRVFVYFGSSSGLAQNPAWFYESNQATAYLGFSLGAAGDVNGDGYGDIIMGADQYDNGQSNEGRAFLFHGSATGPAATPSWTVEGNQADAILGRQVFTAGDVNGDGYSDVIVGARAYTNGQTQEGRAYLFLGSTGGLATTPTWTTEGDQASSRYAGSVATAGDVNGDGYSDIIVTASLYDNGQMDEGRAFLFHGSSNGIAPAPAIVLEGTQNDAALGVSVASAGDVNGDGFSDLILGADRYDNGENDEGRVLVHLGSAAGLSASPSWSAEGGEAEMLFGHSVASAGDVNGDGYADLLVGAPGFRHGQTGEGAAYLYLGSATGVVPDPVWNIEGGQIDAQLGTSVSSAGDVNRDGLADVLIGVPGYEDGEPLEGRVLYFAGDGTSLPGTPSASRESDQAGALFGSSVASAGDVNRDGFSDLLIGAPGYDNGEVDEGRAVVYFGSPFGPALSVSWSGEGEQAGAAFGSSVATAEDVNGDGFSDIIIGAPFHDNGELDEGRVSLYNGSLSGPETVASWISEGDQQDAHLGLAVSAGGDVNADGFSEVITGAPGFEVVTMNEGRVIVHYGSATGPVLPLILPGGQTGGLLGSSIAAAGDVDGDGFGDLVAGAPGADNGQTGEGTTQLHYGNQSHGLARAPRQVRADDSAPVALLGRTDAVSSFRLRAAGRSPMGRSKVALQWELKPLGVALDGTSLTRGSLTDSGIPTAGGSAVPLDEPVVGLSAGTSFHWRLRVVTDSPYFPRLPWITLPGNNQSETDLRTAGCLDADGDGFGTVLDLFCAGGLQIDCDDANVEVYPGASQVCDGVNNDCAAPGWPALTGTNEADADGDTFSVCAGDCTDTDTAVYPGASQVCDGVNNDCAAPGWPALTGTNEADADGDTFSVCAGDCTDTDTAVYPGASQVCDGVNNDCAAPGWPALTGTNEADADGDTFSVCAGDCTDTDTAVYPGASQVCDGVNNDCAAPGWPALTGTNEADADGDTFSVCSGDCTDTDTAVYPGASQVCDGVNNDCAAPGWPSLTGTNEADADGDTFSVCSGDCTDTDTAVYPGAAQVCDGVNNDCAAPGWPALTGTNEADADGDTFSVCAGDCTDTDTAVYPGAAQVCDGVNNDCTAPGWPALTGTNEADADGDTFSVCSGDCTDTDTAVYPGASQVCDGVNNDCTAPGWPALTGTNEADADGDTFSVCSGDCTDTDATAWAVPGEAVDLILDHDPLTATTTLSWSSPISPGASILLYDLLRSGTPADFDSAGSCAETDDGPNTTASDTDMPAPDAFFFYLIRAQNSCPGGMGVGPLGFDSAGVPKLGRACP